MQNAFQEDDETAKCTHNQKLEVAVRLCSSVEGVTLAAI